MPKLKIDQAHTLERAEARRRLDELSGKLSSKYGIESRWISETEAEIKRTGVSGKISCTDREVSVFLDLSFALSPLKSKIEERIRTELQRALG